MHTEPTWRREPPTADADDGDRWLRLPELARYSGLSVRTLQRRIASVRDPLPAYRSGKTLLVRKRDFDHWLTRQRDQAEQVQQSFQDVTDADWRIAMALRGYAVKGR